jgi:hypothetical protein
MMGLDMLAGLRGANLLRVKGVLKQNSRST